MFINRHQHIRSVYHESIRSPLAFRTYMPHPLHTDPVFLHVHAQDWQS